MKLIIARHGEADNNMDDSRRELTDLGRSDVATLSRIIKNTGWDVAEVRSSPVLRAQQTAEIIAETLSFEKENIITENVLRPGVIPDEALGLLENTGSSNAVVWVFHAPDVSIVSSFFTDIPDSRFYWPPGTMLAMNLSASNQQGRAMPIWIIQPEYMRSLEY